MENITLPPGYHLYNLWQVVDENGQIISNHIRRFDAREVRSMYSTMTTKCKIRRYKINLEYVGQDKKA